MPSFVADASAILCRRTRTHLPLTGPRFHFMASSVSLHGVLTFTSWGLQFHLNERQFHFKRSPTHPFYLSRACPLRTAACTPARHAAVAGSATYHERTADVAGGRISHLDKFTERSNRIRTIGIRRWLNGHRKGSK